MHGGADGKDAKQFHPYGKAVFLKAVILRLHRSCKLYIGGLVIYLSNKYHMKQLFQSIP